MAARVRAARRALRVAVQCRQYAVGRNERRRFALGEREVETIRHLVSEAERKSQRGRD